MRTVLVGCALAASSTACAAVFEGGKQEVTFTGAPAGADVKVNGAYAGSLPKVVANIDRDRPPNVVVTADGFREQYVYLQKRPAAGWWFWDIATCVVPIALCIPALVDAISGAWYSYDDQYAVKLDPLPIAAPPTKRRRPVSPPATNEEDAPETQAPPSD